mmetsp:Transcript_58614/g.163519  ORF Transcript_58614/g.163519 Transcript_58614/m.163519 type:complete len:132 (-) Transcript_58614:1545-1940(-)
MSSWTVPGHTSLEDMAGVALGVLLTGTLTGPMGSCCEPRPGCTIMGVEAQWLRTGAWTCLEHADTDVAIEIVGEAARVLRTEALADAASSRGEPFAVCTSTGVDAQEPRTEGWTCAVKWRTIGTPTPLRLR